MWISMIQVAAVVTSVFSDGRSKKSDQSVSVLKRYYSRSLHTPLDPHLQARQDIYKHSTQARIYTNSYFPRQVLRPNMFSVLAARFAPFSIAHPLALALLVLVLQTSLVSAKQAKYGTYNFTFFVEEDCSGETNGESMVGEVGEPYCMNFTQGVMSARAEFTNLSTADGKMLDGESLLISFSLSLLLLSLVSSLEEVKGGCWVNKIKTH